MLNMIVENGQLIGSITDAMLIAKKADGIRSIALCIQGVSEGQVKICPNYDRQKLCTDPEGIIPGTVLQYPKQKGPLTLFCAIINQERCK